jgi:hypothetical protein
MAGQDFLRAPAQSSEKTIQSTVDLLRRKCLLLAQSGHPDALDQCPLLGVKRTFVGHAPMSAAVHFGG